jgi:hypothetical protein
MMTVPLSDVTVKVKLYTHIHFIGPLDLALMSSRVLLHLRYIATVGFAKKGYRRNSYSYVGTTVCKSIIS